MNKNCSKKKQIHINNKHIILILKKFKCREQILCFTYKKDITSFSNSAKLKLLIKLNLKMKCVILKE